MMSSTFKVGRITRAWANSNYVNAWYVEVDVGERESPRLDILYSKSRSYHAKIIGNYVLVNCDINSHYPYHGSLEVTGKVLTTYRQSVDDFMCTSVPAGKHMGDTVTMDEIIGI
jgi:hypothetical protein